jgi:uncharacterized protein (TIGR03905 family)
MTMRKSFRTRGTCSQEIHFTIQQNRVTDIRFTGGCDGNLQAIARLADGMPISEIIRKLQGIRCGKKMTSCADQLATALLAHAPSHEG